MNKLLTLVLFVGSLKAMFPGMAYKPHPDDIKNYNKPLPNELSTGICLARDTWMQNQNPHRYTPSNQYSQAKPYSKKLEALDPQPLMILTNEHQLVIILNEPPYLLLVPNRSNIPTQETLNSFVQLAYQKK